MLKKGDILIFIICFSAIIISCIVIFSVDSPGKTVVIKENNIIVYSSSLFINKTVRLKGNTVVIKDGKVNMIHADCENQICVRHKKISKVGENIVCLPNKVIVEIK